MSEQMKSALGRSVIYTAVAALASAQSYLMNTMDGREAIAVFLAGLSAVLIRLGEGLYDTHRDNTDDIRAGDVGAMH